MWGSSGQPFTSASQAAKDARAVIEFALRDTSIDPERLALRGESFGGWIGGSHAATDPRIRTVVLV
ncbi:MAG: hypothetical protein M3Z65_09540 [Chloroflexota bacterium]|nr:hypothetical protein [Chloroflexota bacterium]